MAHIPIRKYVNIRRSQALVVALVVMAIVTVLAAGFMTYSRTAYMINQVNLENDAAYYLASSGIEFAKYQLSKNFTNYPSGTTTINLSGGKTVTVEVANPVSGVRQVKATATIGSTQQQIIKDYKMVTKSKEACWVLLGSSVVEITEDGVELFRRNISLGYAIVLAVNPNNGTVWIPEFSGGKFYVINPSAGTVTPGNFSGGSNYCDGVAIDSADNTCWMGRGGQVFKFDSSINELGAPFPITIPGNPPQMTLAINSSTGDLFARGIQLARYDRSGNFKNSMNIAGDHLAYNTVNQTILAHDAGIIKRGKDDGTILPSITLPVTSGWSPIAVNPKDGSFWVGGPTGQVWNYDINGNLIHSFTVTSSGSSLIDGISVNPDTGSCWVVTYSGDFYKIDSSGGLKHICFSGGGKPNPAAYPGGNPIFAVSANVSTIEEL